MIVKYNISILLSCVQTHTHMRPKDSFFFIHSWYKSVELDIIMFQNLILSCFKTWYFFHYTWYYQVSQLDICFIISSFINLNVNDILYILMKNTKTDWSHSIHLYTYIIYDLNELICITQIVPNHLISYINTYTTRTVHSKTLNTTINQFN